MILVVEDDPSIRLLLCHIIEEMGISCLAVSGNSEAIEKIPALNPSVILIDMMLSDGNAIPVLKFCQDRFPNTTVVLTTALRKREIEGVVNEFGLKYCLPKPFKVEEVEDILRKLSR